jgi:beta-glucosidase
MKKKNLLLTGLSFLAITVSAQIPRLGKSPLNQVIKAMTLDEKIDLLVGSQGNVSTQATATIGNSAKLVAGAAGQINGIPRLGIPPTVVADGPAGLRIDATRLGSSQKFYCTHFPVATVMSSTWNSQLVYNVGEAMGNEVLHYGVDILLAPAANIQRNPLDGRNFEYYSEDPLLAGTICAAMIKGVQSNGVGTSLKHFVLNNQETNRTSNNVIGSPRTFREIYLKPFEIAVEAAQPWTVMTSYNKINGTMASERSDLLTNILRREWGFKGMVMTDWFGGQHATLQMEAGNDLLMPGKISQREEIKKAVLNGRLSMDIIDRNVRHILELILRTPRFKGYIADNHPDLKAHAVLTRQAAQEGMVLLKNVRNALPLNQRIRKLAVFGRTSYDFIAGGTGSGNVNHAYVVSLIDGLKNAGFDIDPSIQSDYTKYISTTTVKQPFSGIPLAAFLPKHLIPEMTINAPDLHEAARNNDAALITIGKTSGEFADRSIKDNFDLSPQEEKMISDVCKVFHKLGKKVIVVLNVCGVIETPSWIDGPDAVLVAWLPGQEGGNSVTDILTGKESPSGRLPMSWPKSYADVPNKDDFPNPDEISDEQILESLKGFDNQRTEGERKNFDYTKYNDGIYVGYRYYTTKNIPVAFPFGYGLSYTTFKYSQLTVVKDNQGNLEVKVKVTNKGKRSGKEVVEVYVAASGRDMDKPLRELRGFAKTKKLAPDESETVSVNIPYSSLASFNDKENQWQVEAGQYIVEVARNAADMRPLSKKVTELASVTEKVTPSLLPEQK